MGPSGCGKTTLLDILIGHGSNDLIQGKILLDGQEQVNLRSSGVNLGVVPQDDIMLRWQSVADVLAFSAAARLPPSTTKEERLEIVREVAAALGLTQVLDSIIGDENRRGISGGQRRRLSVAMEMVAKPDILFLDEPTSGLDSVAARDLCRKLKYIAVSSGVIVVAVIHQPSSFSARVIR